MKGKDKEKEKDIEKVKVDSLQRERLVGSLLLVQFSSWKSTWGSAEAAAADPFQKKPVRDLSIGRGVGLG